MKNSFFLSVLLVVFALGSTLAQVYSPVATSGYGLDGVAENTTAATTTGGALDASDFVLYSQYYGSLFSSSAVGLPNNGTIVNGQKTWQLQNYTAANALQVNAFLTDSLTFTSPQAYTDLSLLCFGTQGNATINVKVRFTDNTTQTYTSITVNDWFTTASNAVYSGFDRVQRSTDAIAYVAAAGNPIMFDVGLAISCANQGKPIKRLIVQNNSSAYFVAMAVSAKVPTYSVTPTSSLICNGGSVTFSAAGLNSYTWEPAGGFAGSNSPSIAVSPTIATTYTLDGDNNGCPASVLVSVNVSTTQPVLSLSGSSQSVCLGAPATITASGALSYTLSSPAANGATFTPTTTAVYTVTGSNGCGVSSATLSINVSPLSVSASAANTLVCSGSAATLTAAGATTYSWMPGGSTQTNNIVAPTTATVYTVTGKTGNCTGTNTIAVAVKSLPTLNISTNNSVICNGDAASLNISGNAMTYTWSEGNQTSTSISVSPTVTTLYSVTGTNSLNCTASVQQVILVNPNPTVTAAASNPVVCAGGASTLTATGADTYIWSSGDVVNPMTDETYTVTGSYTTGCTATATVSVSVYSPVLGVSSNTALCAGSNVAISANGADTYTWTNNNAMSQGITVSPAASTIYTVTGSITDPNSGVTCDASNTIAVTVNSNPTLTAGSNRNNNVICRGEAAVLTGTGASTYTWTGGAGAVTTQSMSVSPIADQIYTLSGIDANGCKGSAQITVKVSACTGIENIAANSAAVIVYPNPSNGVINITSETAADLIITNELGQMVRTVILNAANAYRSSIDNLSSGVYFMTGISNGAAVKQKIIITH